ncbi:hypothetical protein Q0M94_02055 [Deinococcus radiomollis]|uniref:hypothetical protein n=1 Tax=Deinococcus radiomollis TaxID=468916 RepID=UPI00389242E6
MNWFMPAQNAAHGAPVAEPWEVLLGAPVRHRHVPQRALHGNVRLLVGWGRQVGKTARLLELAAERSRYARVAFVCGAEKVAWVQSRLPDAAVFACPDGRVHPRQLQASGAEEVFVDDLERLHPESSFRLCKLSAHHQDVTVALSAQHLPAPEAFWDAWYDHRPQRCQAAVPELLLRSALSVELIDRRAPQNDTERAWQQATARRVRREQDARAPLAHLLPHALALLPADARQAEALLTHALNAQDGRVFAFLPPCADARKRPGRAEVQALGHLCAGVRVPLIVPAEHPLALRRACLALQPERVLTVHDLPALQDRPGARDLAGRQVASWR